MEGIQTQNWAYTLYAHNIHAAYIHNRWNVFKNEGDVDAAITKGSNHMLSRKHDGTPPYLIREWGDFKDGQFIAKPSVKILSFRKPVGLYLGEASLKPSTAPKQGPEALIAKLNTGVSADADVSETGLTTLMIAAACGETDAITFLAEKGADINAQDDKTDKGQKCTALHLAVLNKQTGAAKLLASLGAKTDIAMKDGKTVDDLIEADEEMKCAVDCGKEQCIENRQRAEIPAQVERGETHSELQPVVGAVLCCILKQKNLTEMAASLNRSSDGRKLPRSIAAVCKAAYAALLPYLQVR